jgi:drug/metabolite transporter (DMT)-like permease
VRTAVIQLVLAVAAAVGCAVSWIAARSWVSVPPILDGEPWTTQTEYSAPLIGLSLLLAAVAGVLAVLAGARLRRGRTARR